MKELTKSERCAIPRHPMPHQDPLERVNHYENAQFLTVRRSLSESLRQWREQAV